MEKFYLYTAVPASIILLIQTLMTFLGLSGEIDTDFDGDGDVDVSGESGLTIFSFRNLIAFFTFFGWSGLWLHSTGMSQVVTAILSVIIGILFMLISMGLFILVGKMQRSGTLNLHNAVGMSGVVYIPIPPSRQNYGKVNLVIQGSLRELEALTDEETELKTGTQVQVISVEENSKLLVKKHIIGG